jgi:hypothetical protein
MKALRRPTHFVLSFAATAMIVACTADMAEQDSTNTLVTITELTEELFASETCSRGDAALRTTRARSL